MIHLSFSKLELNRVKSRHSLQLQMVYRDPNHLHKVTRL